MFHPAPRIESIPLHDGHRCWIIDDVLVDPEAWVARAQSHRDDFASLEVNAYPGIELRLPDAIGTAFAHFFLEHFRTRLGARRLLRAYARLALVTTPPEALHPRQWLCHRDRFGLPAGEMAAASVLYLFPDDRFGGTSFYRPRAPAAAIDRLVHDSGTLDASTFSDRYGLQPGYIDDGHPWFDRVATIPPRFNRLICYDGGLFHCSSVRHGDRLVPEPDSGRLTLNAFFLCTRALGAR